MATIDEDQLIADFVEHFQLDVKRTARRNTRLNKEALLPIIRDYLIRKEEEEYEDDDGDDEHYYDSETSAYDDDEDPDTIPGMYGGDSAHPVRVLGDDTADRKAGSNTQLPSPPSPASSSPQPGGCAAGYDGPPKVIAMVPSVRAIVAPRGRGGGSSRDGELNDGGRVSGRVRGGTQEGQGRIRVKGPTGSVRPTPRGGQEGQARQIQARGPTGSVRVASQEGQERIRVRGPTGTVSVRDNQGEQARQILARGPTGSVRIAPRDVQQRHERPIQVKGPTGSASVAPRTPEQTQLQTPPPSPPHLHGLTSQAPYAPHFMLQEPLYFQLPFHVMKAVVSRKTHEDEERGAGEAVKAFDFQACWSFRVSSMYMYGTFA
ncbi:hypothetical protein KEM55_004453 [Ascosphaera atra]|nr:hypothetical protein KEM55_004453 [Ascosphaera atra]